MKKKEIKHLQKFLNKIEKHHNYNEKYLKKYEKLVTKIYKKNESI